MTKSCKGEVYIGCQTRKGKNDDMSDAKSQALEGMIDSFREVSNIKKKARH